MPIYNLESGMSGGDEIEGEVFDFATLSIFIGLLELIESLGANGQLSDGQLRAIYLRMSAPLDDDKFRDHEAMCELRNELDRAFATARAENKT